MSDSKFDIVFRGDIVRGHSLQDVKQRLSQLFKTDIAKMDSLFTGRAVPLKRNLDAATAEKYKVALTKAGAQVSLIAAGSLSAPRPNPKSTSGDINSVVKKVSAEPVLKESSVKEPSLKERLAALAVEEEREKEAQAKKALEQQSDEPGNGWTLSPVGSPLLTAQESQSEEPIVPVPDTSTISVKPLEGDILDASEKEIPVETSVDVSGYELAAAGADMLAASERKPESITPLSELEFSLAEVGEDLLTGDERSTLPVPEIVAEFDLAPVGADVGQIKKSPPPPPPDTSALSLSE